MPARPRRPAASLSWRGVAVTFHYLNRMVTMFLPESPLPPLTPKPMGGWVMGMLASAMLAAKVAPGLSLDLLPEVPLPAQFQWATGTPQVAQALARADAAIEEAGRGAVPAAVRSSSTSRTAGTQPADMNRAWAEKSAAARRR